MDSTQILTDRSETDGAGGTTCPRCGEAPGATPSVHPRVLGLRWVRRCTRCGTRAGSLRGRDAFVFTCDACGLPFVAESLLPHAEHHCPSCLEGKPPADLPTPAVAAAAEAEIRHGLSGRWKLVRSAGLDAYLGRMARQIAEHVEGAPASPKVVLVDDRALKTLALPSGLVLVSVGTLRFLEDEAELAFVLAHELAHSASGDAAVRLVRHGFSVTQASSGAPDGSVWAEAAEDLVRLGYGRKRERDADARALEAMLALRYETESSLRYLRRLLDRIESGDPAVAELAVAHPPAPDRIRRIEKALYGRLGGDADRKVNREVFRRAISAGLAEPLSPMELSPTIHRPPQAANDLVASPRWGVRIAWTMAAVAAVAGAIAALAYFLG